MEKEPEYFMVLTQSIQNLTFKYAVRKGNNDQVIRKVMQRRYWWRETYSANHVFNFCWQQGTRSIQYDRLNNNRNQKQIVNHYEKNHEITTKIDLIKNLQIYCDV